MAESTSLQLITTSEQRKTAEQLWQLYSHDLSEFRGYMPDSSGHYENARLLSFFGNPDRCGYLTYSDAALVGFALIRGLAGGDQSHYRLLCNPRGTPAARRP